MDNDRLDRFERYFELIQAQLNSMQGQDTALHGQIATMQSQITTMHGQITTMQSQITTMQSQIADLQTSHELLRTEVRERFETADLRFQALEKRMVFLDDRLASGMLIVKQVDERFAPFDDRLKAFGIHIGDIANEVALLSGDIKQRFRGMHERLAEMEKSRAA